MYIQIDDSRDELLTDFGKITLQEQYCLQNESYQQAFARASAAFSNGDEELAQRLYDYVSKHWFAFATPLLTNGGTNRGLPISCFLNYVEDSVMGLANNFVENAFLCTNGGGIGTYWGKIRSIGEKTSKGLETPGLIPFMHCQDSQMIAYHQGKARRGAGATYVDISHPEILEFINMRLPGGDFHRKNLNLHHGICIPDFFMECVAVDGDWELIDPNSGKVKSIVKARELWIKILQQRVKSGEPYLFFVDTANAALPQSQKDKGLYVYHSNLCTEITLPTNEERTAVCCLSSINVAKYDEWVSVKEQFIADLITMLDNALTVFIETAPPQMHKAVASSVAERSLGLGTLGFSSYIQQKGWALESAEAKMFNKNLYAEIKKYAVKASQKLALERGEPEDMVGTGLRNAHLLSIAPNASSSIICGGVSPSIEPLVANAFTQKTQAGSHIVKNPVLIKVLEQYGKNDPETWSSIVLKDGSVQHLDFLSDNHRAVFKTAAEVDQQTLIDLAADRQPYICQAQSVNLFLPPNVDKKVLHTLHYSAWKKGLKSLYYLRSGSVKSTQVGEIKKETIEEQPVVCTLGRECKSCEG